ncbi:hypothetical protein [Leucobacter coleopterorum]|uniref:hypothetical protein n=1 Tax=Leucobacter coleopterorum TaxID=2714933 RepID=UPI001FCA86EA|nr:hypothetical protein [Leucobacter coleopterorum]
MRDWLLSLAAEHQIAPYPTQVVQNSETPELNLSSIAVSLTTHAARARSSCDRTTAALAASAIDYHQREQKSFWWAHFARIVDPVEDWADTRDVLIVDVRSSAVLADWFLPSRARAERRRIRLRGDIAPGSSLKVGTDAFLLYDYPSPFPQPGAAPGARGARRVTIIDRHDDGVTVEEVLPAGPSATPKCRLRWCRVRLRQPELSEARLKSGAKISWLRLIRGSTHATP